ncbi:MAG: hypothetical protein CMN25_00545 [Salinicola sp.]|uniref:hypothetical protein n=1 Tax=uncultured Salinicola sp. TaxID=1193542 RepID=UPI000C990B6E|nr:hypothetical protein [uncultured Salinicola sp.]MAM55812.1 hypothetical protein [Salinicola sp.]
MQDLSLPDAVRVDARERTLHLLPVLQVDPFDRIDVEDISLSVSVSWRDDPISPADGWSIRQPYPNRLYFVGGSAACHLGALIALPADTDRGEVTFRWAVAGEVTKRMPGRFQVTHTLDLTFGGGPGMTYSMDVANWWALSEFAGTGKSPEIGRNRVSRLQATGVSPTRQARVESGSRDDAWQLSIREALTLPAITLGECWTLETYGGEAALSCLEALQ